MRACLIIVLLCVPALVNAQMTAGLGFSVGLGGTLEQDFEKAQDPDDILLSPTLTISPWMEKRLHEMGHIGGELHLMWMRPSAVDKLRFTAHPAVRTRLSFPISGKTTFDGIFAIGPSLWFSTDEMTGSVADTRMGFAVRFGFGVAHPINRKVSAYSSFGYFRSTTFGSNSTAAFSHMPIFVGLRSTN